MKKRLSLTLLTIVLLMTTFAERAQAYYSPDAGRFINRDPIEERGGENVYAFVRNDGVNHCDYLGFNRYEYDSHGLHIHEWFAFQKNLTYLIEFDENGTVHLKPKKKHENEFDEARAKKHFAELMKNPDEVKKLRKVCADKYEVFRDKEGVKNNGQGLRRYRVKGAGFLLGVMGGVLSLDPGDASVRDLNTYLNNIREQLAAGERPNDDDVTRSSVAAADIYGGTLSYLSMKEYLE